MFFLFILLEGLLSCRALISASNFGTRREWLWEAFPVAQHWYAEGPRIVQWSSDSLSVDGGREVDLSLNVGKGVR